MSRDTLKPQRELQYRIGGAVSGLIPGAHRSRGGDNGFEFRSHALLRDAPDARRIDLNASLRDPFGNWMVRLNSQRTAMAVAVVADLSASMGFVGASRKLDVVADFTDCLARSAQHCGDRFAFVACDDTVRTDLALPATRRRGAALALARALRECQPTGRSARGLLAAHRHLPRQRALVFLVSDFHLPLTEVEAVLASLAAHEVVPVVVWQAAEFALTAAQGLAQVVEPETGRRQWLWWRPALRERWLAAQQSRRVALNALFRARRLSPLFIEGGFDADAVTRHFLG
jgi:Mg-chelatase subunit ChlD